MFARRFILMGATLVVIGFPFWRWPYTLARWGEIIDAIGRKPSGRVEPADWAVALDRLFGWLLVGVGVIFLVLGVAIGLATWL